MEYRATADGSPEEADVKARLEPVRIDLETRKLFRSVVNTLLQLDVRRQFPQVHQLDNVAISIDENWEVGYTDHTQSAGELAELLGAFGGLGAVMVVARAGSAPEIRERPATH